MMPKRSPYQIQWSSHTQTYEFFIEQQPASQWIVADKKLWSAWLSNVSSFAFRGRDTSHCTVRKEEIQPGKVYWYAYRYMQGHTTKRYLGRTEDLTLARLEEVCARLATGNNRETAIQNAAAVPDETALTQVESIGAHIVPLLTSKFQAPRLLSKLVVREHLLTRLEAIAECRLALVSAPAGSGKTTLVRQWLARQDRKQQTAWLSLDKHDNDPVRFWRYLLTVCQSFPGSPGQAALTQLHTFLHTTLKTPALETILTTLLNELAQVNVSCTLILEDYHVITELHIHKTLTFLLEHLSPNVHLILISRTVPPLTLARLRAQGELCEIQGDELRFSTAETTDFIEQNLIQQIQPQVTRQIDERVAGWATGLRLLTLALQKCRDEQQMVQCLAQWNGKQGPIQEYFNAEVFATQPPAIQHFLLHTCMLQRLTPELCNKLSGQQESAALLQILEEKALFVERLDGPVPWYRYHPLFAEALWQEAQRQSGRKKLQALLLKASVWFMEHHMHSEAIESALQAEAFPYAATLIERFLETLPIENLGEFRTVHRWLNILPAAILHAHPHLCFAQASALFLVLIQDQQMPTISMFERLTELLAIADTQWLQEKQIEKLAEIAAFRAILERVQGNIPTALQYATRALETLPEDVLHWHSACLSIIAIGEIFVGQFHTAHETLLRTRAHYDFFGNPAFTRVNTGLLGQVYHAQGKLQQAQEMYQELLRQAREDQDRDDICDSLLGLTQLSYEWQHLEQARQQALEACQLAQTLGNIELEIHATCMLARIAHAKGQSSEALHLCNASLRKIAVNTTVAPLLRTQLKHAIQLVQYNCLLDIGNNSEVEHWLERLVLNVHQMPYLQYEQTLLLRVRWQLSTGETEKAQHCLEQLLLAARQEERRQHVLHIQLLMVATYTSMQQAEDKRTLLLATVKQAQHERYLRLFVDQGEAMYVQLRALLHHTREKPVLAYLQTLLQAFPQASDDPYTAMDQLAETLSPQELRVLKLLIEGHANARIADELVVSVNTVKTQVQSIYRKLNVNNRVEAAVSARTLKLFP